MIINFYEKSSSKKLAFVFASLFACIGTGNSHKRPNQVTAAGAGDGEDHESHTLPDAGRYLRKHPVHAGLTGVTSAQPAYENATVVYEDLFKQIDAALTLFSDADKLAAQGGTVLNPGTNDIMFGEPIEAYNISRGNRNWDASPDKIQAIITQKWASLNGWSPFEAWSDYRRLGVPNVLISQDPSTSVKQIPVRLLYPQSEYNFNSSVVRAQGDISPFTSKIFWVK